MPTPVRFPLGLVLLTALLAPHGLRAQVTDGGPGPLAAVLPAALPSAAAPADPARGPAAPSGERSREEPVPALVARAEATLSAALAAPVTSPLALGRARRLIVGARAALADGDARLALRRATYGCQLLGGCTRSPAKPR